MSPDSVLEAVDLTKRFGNLTAVDHVSFTVKAGRLVGFVGPNGAGKTTTLKMILGLLSPDEGVVFRFGREADSRDLETLARIGYVPDVPSFPEWMRPLEFLEYIGGFFSRDAETVKKRAREMMEEFGLERLAGRKVEGFSRGEKQRLGMAQAMMGEPELLVLDEPTSGLDPLGRYEVITYMERMKGKAALIVSTHLLEDVERICDDVLMIDRGRKILDAPLSEIKSFREGDTLTVEVAEGVDRLAAALAGMPWVKAISPRGNALEIMVSDKKAAGREIPAAVARFGLELLRFEGRPPSLEEVFISLTRGDQGEERNGMRGGAG
ncbi:MAG: ABC transporter ATP-binding protein [Actinobacteria bacterium]|nr:ABC transporter ATP-binding protein [Actinomycetota bacterium]